MDNEAAFVAALNERVELVISDYHLPSFTGLKALKRLKKKRPPHSFHPRLRRRGRGNRRGGHQARAADYLLKDRLARLGAAAEQARDAARLQREKGRAVTKYRNIFEHSVEGI